jgi:hypothetical protein
MTFDDLKQNVLGQLGCEICHGSVICEFFCINFKVG